MSACPQCSDLHYVFVEDRGYAPCDRCHAESDLRDRLTRCEVPKRYLDCRIKSYAPQGREQLQAKADVLDTLKPEANPSMLLLGAPGVGKSHLAVACLTEHVKRGLYGLFVSAPELLVKLKEEMATGAQERDFSGGVKRSVIRDAMEAEILLLDDLGAERLTDYSRDQIYTLLDHRYNHELPTIITSNKLTDAALTEHVGERLFSRISEMCKIVRVTGKDYRLQRGASK